MDQVLLAICVTLLKIAHHYNLVIMNTHLSVIPLLIMLYLFRLFQTFIMPNPRYTVDGEMYANISNKYGYNMSKIVYYVDCKHHNY